MLLPKCVEVLLLDGGVEIIYRPQQEHNELPESIRANDGLDGGAQHFLCLHLNHFLIRLLPNHHPPWKVSWRTEPFR